jgi:hypothetical protein
MKKIEIHSVAFMMLAHFTLRWSLLDRDLEPYMFCDESMILSDTKQSFHKQYEDVQFRSLGTSIRLVELALLSMRFLLGPDVDLNSNEVVLLGRFIFLIVIQSFAALVFGSLTQSLFPIPGIFFISVSVFLFFPTVFFRSLVWYPDSYIHSFVVLALYLAYKCMKLSSYKNLLALGCLLALMISTKPTTLIYYFLVILGIYYYRRKIGSRLNMMQHLALHLSTLFALGLINYSALIMPKNFIHGQLFNVRNYSSIDFDFVNGMWFSLFSLFPLSLISGLILYFWGIIAVYKHLFKLEDLERFFLTLFLAPIPVIYILFWSSAGYLIPRNMIVSFPIFALGMSIGISSIFSSPRVSKVMGTLALAFFLFQTSSLFLQNWRALQLPSSNSMKNEISTYIPHGSFVGINQSCNGSPPLEVDSYQVTLDPQTIKGLPYYLFDSRGESRLFRFQTVGIFFDRDLLRSHFNQLNRTRVFQNQIPLAIEIQSKYELLKVFQTNSGFFYLFRKNEM